MEELITINVTKKTHDWLMAHRDSKKKSADKVISCLIDWANEKETQ